VRLDDDLRKENSLQSRRSRLRNIVPAKTAANARNRIAAKRRLLLQPQHSAEPRAVFARRLEPVVGQLFGLKTVLYYKRTLFACSSPAARATGMVNLLNLPSLQYEGYLAISLMHGNNTPSRR
jgi:hypothetical protein